MSVKNQTMRRMTNHMMTREPGVQSVTVVIVVWHAGQVPVTGSIDEPQPIIIIGDGCTVATTTARAKTNKCASKAGMFGWLLH